MARDVHDFYNPELTWSQSQRSDGTWTTPTDAEYDRWMTHTGRDDSTPTGTVNGQYVHPTEYWAYYCFSTTRPGSLDAKRTLGGVKTKRWWTGVGDNATMTWGLDATKQRPSMGVGVEARAHSMVISELKSGSLQVLNVVGEARESASMLTNVVRNAMNDMKHYINSIRHFRGSPKQLAQAYLAFIFGIKPLIMEAYTIGEFICGSLGSAPVGIVKAVVMDDSYGLPAASGTAPRDKTYSGSVRRGVEVGHTFKVAHPEYFELWRYGVTHPWSTAWELTTLSFVIDWFTGMGRFLETLQKPLGLTHLDGYITLFLENNISVRVPKLDSGWTYVSGDSHGTVDYRAKSMQRYPLASFATSMPYLDIGLSPTQLVSGLALLAARA